MAFIKIPRAFYDDHVERELPAPTAFHTTRHHHHILSADPALTDLLDDARFYAGPFGPDTDGQWARKAAQALIAAVAKAEGRS